MQERRTTIDDDLGSIELAWLDHGDPAAERTILCVHGLTRNAHDFDRLAEHLAHRARVIAVDVVGRGGSSWLDDKSGYAVPHYARQLRRFLDVEGIGRVDWIGTSMGGLIALAVAAAEDSPIDRLVLNDIGPFVPRTALEPIGAYVGLDPVFASLDELEAHLRAVHTGFGPLSDDEWRHLATYSARRDGDRLRLHYDPGIAEAFAAAAAEDIDLWPFYDALTCPTLVIRGGDSPLLTAATAEAMTQRGPKAKLVTLPGIGHAPALMAPAQIGVVARFLGLGAA